MSVKRLQKIIEQQGWNVSIENLGKNAKCVELQRFTPAGQDFNISVNCQVMMSSHLFIIFMNAMIHTTLTMKPIFGLVKTDTERMVHLITSRIL